MSKGTVCDYETTIIKSLKSGASSAEISEHLQACESCRETAKVVRFFQLNLMKEPPPKNLPSAGLVWWKFQMREKRRAAENISRPILFAQTAAIITACGTFLWLFYNKSARLSFISTTFEKLLNSLEVIAIPFIIGTICISILCAILIVSLRHFLPEK